eukprot:scaffold3.g6650.t1
MASSVGALRRAAAGARALAAALLAEGELLPGVAAAELAERRRHLAALLPPGAVALLPSAPTVYMAGVIPYPYRPDADLLYLTGLAQPSSLAVVQGGGALTLLVPDRDAWRETWDGRKLGADAAVGVFGADEAYAMSEAGNLLDSLLSGASTVVCDSESPAVAASPLPRLPAMQAALARGRVQPLWPLMHQLRWVKSPAELALMRRSATLAAGAVARCMAASVPGVREHSIAALFEFECKAGGAARMAYPPVVAGGGDACTIHYSRNDKAVAGDQLLLLDGGCELHGYASDVTRTWPVGGRFKAPQRAVYEAVREVHALCVSACRPGASLRELHHASVRALAEALAALGVSPGKTAGDYASSLYRRFYPHSVGHWLGMDTHDSAGVSHDRPLEPGVVLTIEPGLYIPDEEEFGHFRGIGVRIEDDVAITRGGHEVLSAGAPVDPGAIEALVGSAAPA